MFPTPRETIQNVYRSPNRLVILTIKRQPPTRVVRNECHVLGWRAKDHSFTPLENEDTKYCNRTTGKPIAGKSYLTDL